VVRQPFVLVSAKDARCEPGLWRAGSALEVWKQQLAVLKKRATQMLQLGGVEHPSPLSGSLN
jgi:hypothetical protein